MDLATMMAECRDYTQPYRKLIYILISSHDKDTMSRLLGESQFGNSEGNVWDAIVDDIHCSVNDAIDRKWNNTNGNIGIDVSYNGRRYRHDIQHTLDDRYLREFKYGTETLSAWIHPSDATLQRGRLLAVVNSITDNSIPKFALVPVNADLDYVNPVEPIEYYDYHSVSIFQKFLVDIGTPTDRYTLIDIIRALEELTASNRRINKVIFMLSNEDLRRTIIEAYLAMISSPSKALLIRAGYRETCPDATAAARILHYFYVAKI